MHSQFVVNYVLALRMPLLLSTLNDLLFAGFH